MRYLFISLGLFILSVQAQEIHTKHCLYGCPQGVPDTNDMIFRDLYVLSSNDDTKFADWVAYYLTPHEVVGELDLKRKWRADPFLDESETLEPSNPDDYKDLRDFDYDRGHQAPLASFKGSRYASQVNYLSNITPQNMNMNQGVWKNLEEKIRDVIKTGKSVWVLTGPLYETAMDMLPQADEPHVVPSGYWKIVVEGKPGNLNVAAFIFAQNTPRNDPISNHIKTVTEIQNRSGLTFFPRASDPDRTNLLNSINTGWLL